MILLFLHRHSDITGKSIMAKSKGKIVRHHSGQKHAPESPIDSGRKTPQLYNSQSARFTHRMQFGRFYEVAQFMQAWRRVPDKPFYTFDHEQPADEITVESSEE